MAKIQDDILNEFLAELEKTEGFSKEHVRKLRGIFTGGKKLKAADIVKVFSDQLKAQLHDPDRVRHDQGTARNSRSHSQDEPVVFVISGPNGSGKSGVVDAIQFALTGEMARLKGAGTGDVTLADHGPHVEKRNDSDAASVTVKSTSRIWAKRRRSPEPSRRQRLHKSRRTKPQ